MQWPNPNGSITEGVVIEDGDGNKITAADPFFVAPGTGVTWTLGGALPAFAATPTFNMFATMALALVSIFWAASVKAEPENAAERDPPVPSAKNT